MRAQVARELDADGVLAELWAAIEAGDRDKVAEILRHERDLLRVLAELLKLVTVGTGRA